VPTTVRASGQRNELGVKASDVRQVLADLVTGDHPSGDHRE
jgi:hypothetical protein